ncbi:MAG: TolC family protein [Gemmatimonadaceae bacterium]|nr:TolC family protein [Gemmatimonadaceae bacterium]MCW5826638.1 TolC family protein [Gemmatimonadaceae bacterium]
MPRFRFGALGAILLVAQAATPPAAVAQAAPRDATGLSPLTLEEAVTRAMQHGPAAQASSAARQVVVGRARADAQWANPTFELRRENEGSPLPYDDFATFTLPVSFTGRRFALRDALGAARERGAADSLFVQREAGFDAAREWWTVWAASSMADFAAAQATRFAELARFDSLRAAEGAIAEASAIRTRLEAERAGYHAVQATAAAGRARAALAARIGLEDPRTLRIAAPPQLDLSPLTLTSDEAVAQALASRPDVRAAQAAVREADRRRAAEDRGSFADVGVTAGYKGTSGYATGVVGLFVTPPVLNANGGNRERATGEWLLADAERRAIEIRARGEVQAAYDAVRAMDALAVRADAASPARADELASAAEAAYREGHATLTETLEALRAVADLRAAALQATADRHLIRLDLRRAMGAPVLETP